MIIHKQDVTNLEDILKFLQDYVSNEDLEEKYTELELEWLKLSVSQFEMFKERVREEYLNVWNNQYTMAQTKMSANITTM